MGERDTLFLSPVHSPKNEPALGVKFLHRFNHVGLLFFKEFWEYREGESLLRRPFGFREIAGRITEMTKTFLQMQGQGVVNFRSNARLGKVGAQGVASWSANHKLVVDVVVSNARVRPWFDR